MDFAPSLVKKLAEDLALVNESGERLNKKFASLKTTIERVSLFLDDDDDAKELSGEFQMALHEFGTISAFISQATDRVFEITESMIRRTIAQKQMEDIEREDDE